MAPAVWPPSWSQPLALLQLDTADRAVIRVAGESDLWSASEVLRSDEWVVS